MTKAREQPYQSVGKDLGRARLERASYSAATGGHVRHTQ